MTDKEYPGELNAPVVCGGVLVRPGDYIVADSDGVVVVPPENAQDIVCKALERERKEAEMRERLTKGELTVDLLGLRPRLPNRE
jgi:4-hydroxy-4-methyl-2-oxoglutarate aldolase